MSYPIAYFFCRYSLHHLIVASSLIFFSLLSTFFLVFQFFCFLVIYISVFSQLSFFEDDHIKWFVSFWHLSSLIFLDTSQVCTKKCFHRAAIYFIYFWFSYNPYFWGPKYSINMFVSSLCFSSICFSRSVWNLTIINLKVKSTNPNGKISFKI